MTNKNWEVEYFNPKDECDWQLAEAICGEYRLPTFIVGAHRNDRFTRLLIYRTQYTLQVGLKYTKRINGELTVTNRNKFVYHLVLYFLYIVAIRKTMGDPLITTKVPNIAWRYGSIHTTKLLAACEAPTDEITSSCFGILVSLWEDTGLEMDDLVMAVYDKMTSERFVERFKELSAPPSDRFAMERARSHDDNELLSGVENETE